MLFIYLWDSKYYYSHDLTCPLQKNSVGCISKIIKEKLILSNKVIKISYHEHDFDDNNLVEYIRTHNFDSNNIFSSSRDRNVQKSMKNSSIGYFKIKIS